jgi:outer membrane protein OmpA-like peptidoglycan-associated protein
MKKLLIAILCGSMLLYGCASMTRTQVGTGAGAAVGAAAGAAIAKNSVLGAILGAVVGGTAGYFIGKAMDKQAEELKQSIPGAEVERVGEGINVTFESGLLFTLASDRLSAEAQQNLRKFAEVVNKYSDTNILIEGHTSDRGDPTNDEINMELSRKRALAVGNFLRQQGVSSNRVIEKWYGETQPKVPNDSEENMRLNRRVEVAIYANDKMVDDAQAGRYQE